MRSDMMNDGKRTVVVSEGFFDVGFDLVDHMQNFGATPTYNAEQATRGLRCSDILMMISRGPDSATFASNPQLDAVPLQQGRH